MMTEFSAIAMNMNDSAVEKCRMDPANQHPTQPGSEATEPRFKVGQRFKTRDKHPRVCTIVDILRTFNIAGECVKLRYVATHDFCGQTVTDHDVADATIARGGLIDG